MQGRTYYRSATETALDVEPLGGPYSNVVDYAGPLPVVIGGWLVTPAAVDPTENFEFFWVDDIAPHRAENDAWMTHPTDVDYLEPNARWCRVCTLPNSHPVHKS